MGVTDLSNLISISAIGVGAASLATVSYGIFTPTSSLLCPVITRAEGSTPGLIALTFDDGPTPGITDRILDTLRDAGAHATFFVVGESAVRHADLVRRAVAEGHAIGNHTAAHSYACCFRWARGWEQELRRADDLIESIIGRRPLLFRPPLGFKTPHLAHACRRTGHRVVAWSRRALDGLPTTPGRIVARLGRAGPGEILALHDDHPVLSHPNPNATIEALPRLLELLHSRGLRSVALDQLLAIPAYAPPSGSHDPAHMYSS